MVFVVVWFVSAGVLSAVCRRPHAADQYCIAYRIFETNVLGYWIIIWSVRISVKTPSMEIAQLNGI